MKKENKNSLMAFGGKEKTYQAWNGIDRKTWETILNLIIREQFMIRTGKTSLDFMIMKRIITDKTLSVALGTEIQ
jgi:hypothetical protein